MRERSETTEVVGKATELLVAVARDQVVVLEPEAAAAVPVDAGLDREHHPLEDLAAAGLVGIGRLVRAGADAVADRMRRLTRVTRLGDPSADHPVELREARAGTR